MFLSKKGEESPSAALRCHLPLRLGGHPLKPPITFQPHNVIPAKARVSYTNLSLDVYIPRSQGLTLFDCSLGKHTSQSKNTNNGSGLQVPLG